MEKSIFLIIDEVSSPIRYIAHDEEGNRHIIIFDDLDLDLVVGNGYKIFYYDIQKQYVRVKKVNQIPELIYDASQVKQIEGIKANISSESKISESHIMPIEKKGASQIPSEAEITEYLKRYEYVKKEMLKKTDIQIITTSEGPREFIKKSGWRKFINVFRLSIELLEKTERTLEGMPEFEVIVRVYAPSNQFCDGMAICQRLEKNKKVKSRHEMFTTAYTRAVNRAVSDLVAFGEVSAEELED